jgi:hypothetical protein
MLQTRGKFFPRSLSFKAGAIEKVVLESKEFHNQPHIQNITQKQQPLYIHLSQPWQILQVYI